MNAIPNGYGLSYIDGKPYYVFRMYPEFKCGNFTFGFDASFRFDEAGKIRNQDWGNFASAMRGLRYVKYYSNRKNASYESNISEKPIEVMIRVGDLENVTIGSGSIVQNYTNRSIYDVRKIGLEMRGHYKNWTIESFMSNITSLEIIGGYFEFTEKIQAGTFLKSLTISLTSVADFSQTARWVSLLSDRSAETKVGIIGLYGLNIQFKLIESDKTDIYLNSEFNQNFQKNYRENGISGGSIELKAKFQNRSRSLLTSFSVKHLFTQDGYMATYFDGFYEIDRYKVTQINNVISPLFVQTKFNKSFWGQVSAQQIFTSLNVIYADRNALSDIERKEFIFEGNCAYSYFGESHTQIYLGLGLKNLIPSISGHLRLHKRISNQKTSTFFDDKTLIRSELIFNLFENVKMGLNYDLTFSPAHLQDSKNSIFYKKQARFEPTININLKF